MIQGIVSVVLEGGGEVVGLLSEVEGEILRSRGREGRRMIKRSLSSVHVRPVTISHPLGKNC